MAISMAGYAAGAEVTGPTPFGKTPDGEAVQVFSATGLPIIVAVTTVAVESGQMTQQGQSIVVAAGMLTVLFLPVLALGLHRPDDPAETAAPGAAGAGPPSSGGG